MNVEIGTETPIFLFWEYLFKNFGIFSLQCVLTRPDACQSAALRQCEGKQLPKSGRNVSHAALS
jgi:hypothetical protein